MLVLLSVVLFHFAIVILLMKEAQRRLTSSDGSEPVIIEFLPRAATSREPMGSSTHHIARAPAAARAARVDAAVATDEEMSVSALAAPPVDWRREADIAAQLHFITAESTPSSRFQ
jgi:hypothetical protein